MQPHSIARAVAAAVVLGAAMQAGAAQAATLFAEDFEGYSSFPTIVNTFTGVPAGHPTAGTVQERINGGLPLRSEGAKEIWYGARFEGDGATGASVSGDLAVQNYGSINRHDDPNRNYTHVGRFEDDAGLVFRISTTGYTNVQLGFDWRTYNVESTDVVRVGYRLSNPGFGTCTGSGESGCLADLRSGAGQWTSWTEFTLSDAATAGSPRGNNNSWLHESFLMPAGAAEIWVAFWLDNGEGDIGKIDNVVVTATAVVPGPVPLPAAVWLLGSAMVGIAVVARRR